ncbi:MAG TPA: aminotransferase class I/II-fold pyridoxal phosphate-dependent enzyme [Chitinophagales bacterium]|nr:aminotransferase class I/II-fold pyridoxal phosphate-dependent enzyme [Chitinophagales bacterium]
MKTKNGKSINHETELLNGFAPSKDGIHSLLNTEKGRRWLSAIDDAYERGIYAYQPTLENFQNARATVDGKKFLVFSSYDYLGLIGNREINEAAADAIHQFGTGTGGVRLLTGTLSIHRECEAALARFMRCEDSITFTSGYMANLALFSSINDHETLFIVDSLIHHSIIDALKLANGNIRRFHHNDVESIENILQTETNRKRKIIVTEGIFSMEGDIPPLKEIVGLKQNHECFLIIDESHSFGVLGKSGRGVTEHFNIDPNEVDAFVFSLSKVVPANGGCIAGSGELIALLQHDSSPFIFSGSMSPPVAAAIIKSVEVIEKAESSREMLYKKTEFLRQTIFSEGYVAAHSISPIVPLIAGTDESTYRLAKFLRAQGILVSPVVFPAVRRGKSRIRLCVNIDHAVDDIKYLGSCLHHFQNTEWLARENQ